MTESRGARKPKTMLTRGGAYVVESEDVSTYGEKMRAAVDGVRLVNATKRGRPSQLIGAVRPKTATKLPSRSVAVAAEAVVAAQFARCGFDVSVQYGANQPEYDLMVARGDRLLKVSVKGSQDGSWGLTQTLLKKVGRLNGKPNYHGAIDLWLKRHGVRTVLCFVQFKGVAFDAMPRLYLARPSEVATRLRATARDRGDTILYEKKVWGKRATAHGAVDEIPARWTFSRERIEELLDRD